MTESSVRISWGRVVQQAIAAGIAGGIVFDLYLWLTTVLPQHGSMIAVWQFIASTAIGKTAFTSVTFAWLGLLIHALVSIGWAGAYAYLAEKQPVLNERWPVSGIVYGLIVYVLMQMILLAANSFTFPPNPNAFINLVVAHMLFFGLPVAYVVSAMRPRNAA